MANAGESEERARRGRKRFRALIASPYTVVAGGVCIAVAMLGVCSIVLCQGRDDALTHARNTAGSIATMAARDIQRNVDLHEVSLRILAGGLQRSVRCGLSAQQAEVIGGHDIFARFLGATVVTNEAGDTLMGCELQEPSKASLSELDFFLVHRNHPDVGLYIGAPRISWLRHGAPAIALSVRRSHPDGSFAGVVAMGLDLAYFQSVFEGLELGPHGAAALISSNGVVLTRVPGGLGFIGRDVSEAPPVRRFLSGETESFFALSSLDGESRVYSFRRVAGTPFIVVIGLGSQDIYATWKQRASKVGLLMLACCLGTVALSAALSVELARRKRAESELRVLAGTDVLTGLHNRRALTAILAEEWRLAQRYGSALSLLFVDIDFFKSYNDTYGHQAGDDALVAIGRCISKLVQGQFDAAGRYGGEEFLVVLPNTPSAGAEQMAETIRSTISALSIAHKHSSFGHITASIGVTSLAPKHESKLAAAIRAADDALYRAKAAGRNTVAVFPALR